MKNRNLNPLTAGFYALLVYLVFCVAHARAENAAPIPRFTGLIVDQVKLLSADERTSIETRLKAIQASGRAQIGILIASGTGDEPLAQYSLRVAEAWQLGRKDKDNGLLILIVPAKNAARIEVGYGLEGSIPDARASAYIQDFLPSLKNGTAAAELGILLDKIEVVLPQTVKKPTSATAAELLDAHPEWKLPFVLVVFSLLTLFPLFLGRWGGFISAPLLATMYGFAAWGLWGTNTAGYIAAAIAFPLPLLWNLNRVKGRRLGPAARYGLVFGNLCAVVLFFTILTLFTGLAVWGIEEVWLAPLFALLMSTGLAIFLFPGKPAHYLALFLRSLFHFIFMLAVVYSAISPVYPQPFTPAVSAAGLFTALVAIGLFLDSRETKAATSGEQVAGRRWSLWVFTVAILLLLPFAAVALIYAVLGDELYTRIAQASTGGGSLAAVIWWAARQGFFGLVIGLGGKFGGGGAGRNG